MQRTPTYVLLVALAVLLAGCAGVSATDTAATATTDDAAAANAVTAGGTGEVSADPDVASVAVAVEARADTAEAARDAVATDAGALREALSDAGLTANTTGYYLSPEYDYTDDGRELVGYRAVESFGVETPVGRAGEAVDAGATRVDGVSFGLSDERRADLRAEAVTAATADARADADAVAASLDRSVGGVVSVDVGTDGAPVPYVREEASDAGGSGAATTFQPGPVTVTATVTVTYELAE